MPQSPHPSRDGDNENRPQTSGGGVGVNAGEMIQWNDEMSQQTVSTWSFDDRVESWTPTRVDRKHYWENKGPVH
jgi:hypothetical protein